MDEEQLVGEIYGVAGLPTGGIGIFGKYKSWPRWGGDAKPSNALFFTDKRLFLMFIEVSTSMGMKILAGDLGYIKRDNVKQKAEETLIGMSPKEILHTNTHNIAIPFDELEEAKLRKLKEQGSRGDSFIIKTVSQRNYKYQFLNANDIPLLEQILSKVLIHKAVIESGKLIR